MWAGVGGGRRSVPTLLGKEGRTSFIRQVHFWGWGQNNIQQGTFIRSVSSFQPAWIESDPLSLFQEINQGHRNEPLRTWGKYDGNHTRVQDKLHQVITFYYTQSKFYIHREFLECIPDVIFFQDCIQEEDITNVLNEVSRNGYKIHFQVRESESSLLSWSKTLHYQIFLQYRNFLRKPKRGKKVPEEGEMLGKRREVGGGGRRMQSLLLKPPLQSLGSPTSILGHRFR